MEWVNFKSKRVHSVCSLNEIFNTFLGVPCGIMKNQFKLQNLVLGGGTNLVKMEKDNFKNVRNILKLAMKKGFISYIILFLKTTSMYFDLTLT